MKEGAQFCNECGAKVTQTTRTAPPAQTNSGAASQPVQAAAPQTDSGAAPKKGEERVPDLGPEACRGYRADLLFLPVYDRFVRSRGGRLERDSY